MPGPEFTVSQSGQPMKRSTKNNARQIRIAENMNFTCRSDRGRLAHLDILKRCRIFIIQSLPNWGEHVTPGVRLFLQKPDFADVGKITVALGKINAVANNKFIRYFEADPVGFDVDFAPGWFIEQRNCFQLVRLA